MMYGSLEQPTGLSLINSCAYDENQFFQRYGITTAQAGETCWLSAGKHKIQCISNVFEHKSVKLCKTKMCVCKSGILVFFYHHIFYTKLPQRFTVTDGFGSFFYRGGLQFLHLGFAISPAGSRVAPPGSRNMAMNWEVEKNARSIRS